MSTQRVPYYVLRYLMCNMLHMDMSLSHQEKETYLSKVFEDVPEIKDSLHLLNAIFGLKVGWNLESFCISLAQLLSKRHWKLKNSEISNIGIFENVTRNRSIAKIRIFENVTRN